MEKQLLLGKSKNAEHEIECLSREYAKLLGHQNHKQKIHHILKLKEENLSLKQVGKVVVLTLFMSSEQCHYSSCIPVFTVKS
jgi:hypothetical protein